MCINTGPVDKPNERSQKTRKNAWNVPVIVSSHLFALRNATFSVRADFWTASLTNISCLWVSAWSDSIIIHLWKCEPSRRFPFSLILHCCFDKLPSTCQLSSQQVSFILEDELKKRQHFTPWNTAFWHTLKPLQTEYFRCTVDIKTVPYLNSHLGLF